MPEESGEERTEEATPRRRHEFRERGQVARSAEVNGVAVLLGGLVLLALSAPLVYAGLAGVMRQALGESLAQPLALASAQELMGCVMLRALGHVAPLAGGLVLVALLVSYGQVGLMVTPKSLEPNMNIGQMGKIYEIDGATIEFVGENPLRKVDVAVGIWNRYEVVCKGDTSTVALNGQVVNRAKNASGSSGPIGLQSEGVPLHFRTIAIKPLGD